MLNDFEKGIFYYQEGDYYDDLRKSLQGNKNIPSLDTGLLSMDYTPMNGSVLENGNYDMLNISHVDKLLCSCLASGMSYTEAITTINKSTGVEFMEAVVKERVKLFQEMYTSLAMSQTNILADRKTHPFRR